MLARTESEVNEQINEGLASRQTKWPNLTYEEGVVAALAWAIGRTDDKPMEDFHA